MLLDQQIPMEWAFTGPATIAARMGIQDLDPAAVARFDQAEFVALMTGPPAVHRYPRSMGARVQKLARSSSTATAGMCPECGQRPVLARSCAGGWPTCQVMVTRRPGFWSLCSASSWMSGQPDGERRRVPTAKKDPGGRSRTWSMHSRWPRSANTSVRPSRRPRGDDASGGRDDGESGPCRRLDRSRVTLDRELRRGAWKHRPCQNVELRVVIRSYP